MPRMPAVAATMFALVAGAPTQKTLPGVTYFLHSVSVPSGDGAMSAAMEAQRADWTGDVAWAGNRGRMDIVDGSAPAMWAKGDYVLFEADEFIIVQPSGRSFFSVPRDLAGGAMNFAGTAGIQVTVRNIKASVDTLGGSDSLGGLLTQHYRMNSAYTMVMDLSGLGEDAAAFAPPPMETKTTTDYWLAEIADFPRAPFAAMPGTTRMPTAGPMKDLFDKMAAMTAAFPAGRTALRSVTSTRIAGAGSLLGSGGTDVTTEITAIRRGEVDVVRLTLPDDFREVPMPGLSGVFPNGVPVSKDGGAKWRAMPSASR
jgi:hypothetical protein